MDVTKAEITLNGEAIFGLYSDDKMLVKDDDECLTTARERLTEAIECLSDYCEIAPRYRVKGLVDCVFLPRNGSH